MVDLDKYCVRVDGKKDYDKVAKLLDGAGKRWVIGDRYTDWSPYTSWICFGKMVTLYLELDEGRWSLTPFKKLILLDLAGLKTLLGK